MKKENINWDINELPSGHENRFLERLNKLEENEKIHVSEAITSMHNAKTNNWKWFQIAAAACILVCLSIGGTLFVQQQNKYTLPDTVAMQSNALNESIELQLAQLETEKNPETERLVRDVKINLNKMQNDYESIYADLKRNENPKVLLSLIQNLKQRASLLETALIQIENAKSLQQTNDEKIY